MCTFSIGDKKNLKFSYQGLLINLFLVTAYLCLCIKAFIRRFEIVIPNQTLIGIIVDVIALIFQTLTICHCLLIFAFNQKRLGIFFEKFNKIEHLIVQISPKKRRNRDFVSKVILMGTKLTVITIAYFLISLIDHFRFLINDSLSITEIIFWFLFYTPHIIVYNSIFVFIEAISSIQDYFHELNSSLRQYNNNYERLRGNLIHTLYNYPN